MPTVRTKNPSTGQYEYTEEGAAESTSQRTREASQDASRLSKAVGETGSAEADDEQPPKPGDYKSLGEYAAARKAFSDRKAKKNPMAQAVQNMRAKQ